MDAFECASNFYRSRKQFDLVITDLNLPDDTGFEICTFLKENKETADTHIIFISAVDDADTVAGAYATGANGYLAKPIIPVEFACQVESLQKQRTLASRLKIKGRQARDAAKSSMLESERLHLVIEFVQEVSNAKSYNTMAEITFNFMSKVGMAGSLMVYYDDKHLYFADDGQERELEQKLMMELWKKVHNDTNNQTRFFSSRGRVAASFNNCSMFIRGTKTGQEDSLLDFLGLFINQLDKAVERASNEQKILQYLSDASQIITTVDQEISRFEADLLSFPKDQCVALQDQIAKHMSLISDRIALLLPDKQKAGQQVHL